MPIRSSIARTRSRVAASAGGRPQRPIEEWKPDSTTSERDQLALVAQQQLVRDDAESPAQLEQVPALLAEQAHVRVGRPHRIEIAGDELEERRLAGAVGPEDRGAPLRRDLERQAVEDARLAAIDGGVLDLEQRRAAAAGELAEDRLAIGGVLAHRV